METKKAKKKSIKLIIDEMATKEIEKQLNNLPQAINRAVNNAILSILGLSSDGRIDHCNSRYTMLEDIIKLEASKDISEIIRGVKLKYNFDQYKNEFLREYMTQVRSQISYYARSKAEAVCKQKFEDMIKKVIPEKIEQGG